MPIETTYRGYTARIERDAAAGVYQGRVDLPGHTLIFEADTLADLAGEFERAMDTFLRDFAALNWCSLDWTMLP